MQRANQRTVTRHIPPENKAIRCNGMSRPVGNCSMQHYRQVPAISLRGSWPISHLVNDDAMVGLAILYRNLGGNQW